MSFIHGLKAGVAQVVETRLGVTVAQVPWPITERRSIDGREWTLWTDDDPRYTVASRDEQTTPESSPNALSDFECVFKLSAEEALDNTDREAQHTAIMRQFDSLVDELLGRQLPDSFATVMEMTFPTMADETAARDVSVMQVICDIRVTAQTRSSPQPQTQGAEN